MSTQHILKVVLSWQASSRQVIITSENSTNSLEWQSKSEDKLEKVIQLSEMPKEKGDTQCALALFMALTQVVELSQETDYIDIQLARWPEESLPHYFSWFQKSRHWREKNAEQYQSFLHNLHALILQLAAPKAVNLKPRLVNGITTAFSAIDNLSVSNSNNNNSHSNNGNENNHKNTVLTVNQIYQQHLKKHDELNRHEKKQKKSNAKNKSDKSNDRDLINIPKPVLFYKQYHKRELEYHAYNLFCDASVRPLEKRTCIAGYIQAHSNNSNSEQLVNYRQALDYETFKDNNLAEIYALRQGLIIAQQMHITHLKIFTDSMFAVEHTRFQPSRKTQALAEDFKAMIADIRNLLLAFENYEIEHVHRNYNSVADEMTHF